MTAATEASKAVYFPVRSKFPWGQFLQAAVVIVIVGWVIVSFVVSGVFDFATVARYLFGPQIWAGLWGTVSLATLSTAIADTRFRFPGKRGAGDDASRGTAS